MANCVGISATNLDKILWIICPGDFHLDSIKVESKKIEFLNNLKAIFNQ